MKFSPPELLQDRQFRSQLIKVMCALRYIRKSNGMVKRFIRTLYAGNYLRNQSTRTCVPKKCAYYITKAFIQPQGTLHST